MTLMQIRQLKVSFKQQAQEVVALQDVNFSLQAGKTLALVGESGSGKSLTALALMQLLPLHAQIHPDSCVLLNDEELMNKSEVAMRVVRGKRMAMIFQEPMTALNPVLTVGEQIAEVFSVSTKMNKRARRQRVCDLLESVGIAESRTRFDSYPHQLSGGLKQRVMIAMALALEPEVLIADEPTTALDVTIQAQILTLLGELQQKYGMALLLITHDLGVVRGMADEVAVMYAGQIVEQAATEDFFQTPQHPYSQQLLKTMPELHPSDHALHVIPGQVPLLGSYPKACRFAPRCQAAWSPCEQQAPAWLAMTKTHQVRCHLYDPEHTQQNTKTAAVTPKALARVSSADEVLLRLNDLKVHFPLCEGFFQRAKHWVKAVDGVNLAVKKAKTLAIVGESGCGKTTVAKSLVGLWPLTAGQIQWQQEDLSQSTALERARMVQMIFQDPFSALNPRRMIFDIITEGLMSVNKKNKDQRARHLLQQVGLPQGVLMRYPHQLSGGQRQRLGIARALAMQPKVLVCDEPTSALDVSVQAQVLNLLKTIQAQQHMTYVFISHDMAVVSYMADTIAVMYLGRIVEQGDARNVLQDPKHPYTQALLAAVPKVHQQGKATRLLLEGEQPSPIHPPTGCHFHTRCPHAKPECRRLYPQSTQLTSDHQVACHLYTA